MLTGDTAIHRSLHTFFSHQCVYVYNVSKAESGSQSDLHVVYTRIGCVWFMAFA